MFIIWLVDWDFYDEISRSEAVLEYIQFVFYLLAATIFFSVYLTLKRKSNIALFFIMLSLCFFFVAMEEINWGQVIFKFRTPEFIRTINSQEEFSIHNSKIVETVLHELYILVGFGGAFLPFCKNRLVRRKKFSMIINFLPDKSLFFYFFSVGGYYFFRDYIRRFIAYLTHSEPIAMFNQEIPETLFSMGIFLYACIQFVKKEVYLSK